MSPRKANLIAGGMAGSGAGLALIIAMSGPLIGGFEGDVNATYRDPAGILTACRGHTGPELHMGQVFTPAECKVIFDADQKAIVKRITACTKGGAPLETWVAMTSFAFNAGSGRYCAKFAPLIDRGDVAGACAKLSLYYYAAGKPFDGLKRRRAAERALCEKGLT